MHVRHDTSFKLIVWSTILLLVPTAMPISAEDETAIEREPDPAEGQRLSTPCSACHGTDGNSAVPSYPNMGGQNAKYLEKQMLLMRSGEREVAVMAGQLDALSDEDIGDIAAFYATQPKVTLQTKPDLIELGESIYRGGILKKNVAACTSCHAPNGDGNSLAGFPRIAGQPVEYTVAQLKAYREDQRITDENFDGMMRDVAKNLTDTEMQAVANYIKGVY